MVSSTVCPPCGSAAHARCHRSIRVLFFVLGAAMGVWGAQVPAVKQWHGLDEQMLSFALLAAAGGAVLCLLSAGALVARFGVRRCVLAGGLAMLLAPAVALLGFLLVGLGLANVVPVMFAASAQVPGVAPAHGVAAVSSVGYLGFMVGPPLIGALARWSSLTTALWAVALFAVLMGAAASAVLARGR